MILSNDKRRFASEKSIDATKKRSTLEASSKTSSSSTLVIITSNAYNAVRTEKYTQDLVKNFFRVALKVI